MTATRERKLRFMRDFGPFALRDAVVAAFDREGADFLTDEQLDGIVAQQVSDWKFSAKLARRNRAIYANRKVS